MNLKILGRKKVNDTVDFADYIKVSWNEYKNICGPIGTGKTSFLKFILDYNQSAKKENSKDDNNKHFIIPLDFSDYSGKTYDQAICYFRKKMSDLYVSLLEQIKEELRLWRDWENYLDVIEGISSDEALKYSLEDIVQKIRYRLGRSDQYYRPLITIDEVSRPLLYASKYGYYHELKQFYDAFLDIDHYEMTAGIITTSYAPVNTDVFYDLKYTTNAPINIIEPLRTIGCRNGLMLDEPEKKEHYSRKLRYFREMVSLEECFERMMVDSSFAEAADYDYEIRLSDKIESFVNTKRIWIINSKYEEEDAEKRRKKREKMEFAEPLPWGICFPSRFAGIRKLDIKAEDIQNYHRLNGTLKQLYDEYGTDITIRQVYDCIQHIAGYYKNYEEIKDCVVVLKEYADAKKYFEKCWINVDDSNWARFELRRNKNDGLSDMSLIKVFVSVSDQDNLLKVFENLTKFLVDKGTQLFHAKISLRERNDHICFWVSREDFLMFEKYISKYDDVLYKPLVFTAYRGKLGISREFVTWSSHNGFVAELISMYLKCVKSTDDIDVIDMYSQFVEAWNGDRSADDSFSKELKKSNAQELIIMLESLNVILGNNVIDDDNILLSSDASLWTALGESKNWHEVGIKLRDKVLVGAR